MYLKFKDSDDECVSFEYNKVNNVFRILDKSNRIVCEYYPQLYLDPEYEPNNFQYYFLQNERKDYSENSIFQVYISEERVGWIFPIQAIISDEHAYRENSYFLKYAYVGSCLLLRDINSWNEKEIMDGEIKLTDFYNDSVSILILDNDNLKKINDFSLQNYTVSLYQKGYAYTGKGNLCSEIEKLDKRLNLKPIAKELQQIQYIHTLFEKEIPKEQEAFAKFHTYYQIIEILIAVVFEDKFMRFVKELNKDANSLFDKRDELGHMVLEKQRVKWLFSNYVKVSEENISVLNSQCKELLCLNGKKISETMPENLYSVRCLLVHSMYILSEESHELLKEINNSFLDIIIEMLLSFSTGK